MLTTLAVFASASAYASDHSDAPNVEDDPAADLADLYAFTENDKLVVVVTYAGLTAAGASATYDAGVLYGVHLDTDGDAVADQDVWVRFGQNDAGDWGVQVENLPGTDAAVVGAVNTNIDAGDGMRVFAGLRDDPFFFDLTGFQETVSTGTLAFDSTRDSFAGTNVTAIVLEMDAGAATADGFAAIWATTGRK